MRKVQQGGEKKIEKNREKRLKELKEVLAKVAGSQIKEGKGTVTEGK